MLELTDHVAGTANKVITRRRPGTRDVVIRLTRRGWKRSLR